MNASDTIFTFGGSTVDTFSMFEHTYLYVATTTSLTAYSLT